MRWGGMTQPQIVWLRRDLRMADNPALYHAAQAGPVIAVYVLDDERAGSHACGGASRWWLHHSLESLQNSFAQRHARIILRKGDAVEELCKIAKETGAETVHANRHYEPWWRKAQGELKERLDLQLYDANYLLPPGAVTTGSGTPYKIYTPFAKATLEMLPPRDVLPEPDTLSSPEIWPASDDLADWKLLPTRPDWAGGMREFWEVGEKAAHERLDWWEDHTDDYDDARNLTVVVVYSDRAPGTGKPSTSHTSKPVSSRPTSISARSARCRSGMRSSTSARMAGRPMRKSSSGAIMRRTRSRNSRAMRSTITAKILTKSRGAIRRMTKPLRAI